jgi:hypothetical protein
MPAPRRPQSRGSRQSSRGRALALICAAAWLVLLVGLGVVALSTASQVRARALAGPLTTSPAATCDPSSGCTSTPTITATATPTQHSTHAPTVTATKAATATATTASSGGGGGGNPNNPGSAAGQPTKVVLAQPTYGGGDSGPLQGITPAAFGSNGLLFATTMSCVVALLGLIVVAVAMRVLLRGGYGPFMRALLLGKRAGRKRSGKGAKASSAGRGRRDADDFDDYAPMSGSMESYATPARPPDAGRRGRSSRPDRW